MKRPEECWGKAYAILNRMVRDGSLNSNYLSQNLKEVGKQMIEIPM